MCIKKFEDNAATPKGPDPAAARSDGRSRLGGGGSGLDGRGRSREQRQGRYFNSTSV